MIKRYEELLFVYEDEILKLIAICKDFKIAYNKVFKDKVLLNYAFKIDETSKQYKESYFLQRAYNEIYKKYICLYNGFSPLFKKILYCIEESYKMLGFIFDCDIIKLIDNYKKDVKKCK